MPIHRTLEVRPNLRSYDGRKMENAGRLRFMPSLRLVPYASDGHTAAHGTVWFKDCLSEILTRCWWKYDGINLCR
jgi:hypothetical protein